MNRNIITITAGMLFLLSQTAPTLAASSVQFGAASSAVAENAGEVLLSVTRTGDLETVVTVDYLTADNTAKAGEDYTAASGTLSFAAGQTNQTLRISILNDGLREATESFSVTMTNPSPNAVLGSRVSTTVSIQDNDTGIQVEFPQYWAGEGTGFVVVAVVRGPDENMAATVDYTTAALTATPGTDYTETSGALSFTAEEKLKLIPIPILNDGLKEPDEKFSLKLSNATGDVLGTRSTATITITDNDPGVQFEFNRYWVQENGVALTVNVFRGNDGEFSPFTVDFATSDVTAMAGQDYTGIQSTLSFAAGETVKSIAVPITYDEQSEADEQFSLILRNPSAGADLDTNATATVTVLDTTGIADHRFDGINLSPSQGVQLLLGGGVPNRFTNYFDLYSIEASTDLVNWNSMAWLAKPNAPSLPLVFQDAPSTQSERRFYRLAAANLITPHVLPTGPFSVGRVDRLLTDPNRNNRYAISTNGSLMVSIWYPTERRAGMMPSQYEEELVARHQYWSEQGLQDRRLHFVTYAFASAPIMSAQNRYPVVLYSHGYYCNRRDNQDKAQELASRGYVVVAPDHFDAWVTVFPDGQFFRAPEAIDDAEALTGRVKDLVVVLDTLEEWNRNDAFLAGWLDLSKVAAMGFSYGATAAAEFCRIDDRCLAVVSLDGAFETVSLDGFDPLLPEFGLQKPSIMLNNSSHSGNELFAKAKADAVWFQLSSTTHFSFSSWHWSISSTSSGIERERAATRTIVAYTASFLNKYLNGQDDHLLDGPSPDYPRVIGFKKK